MAAWATRTALGLVPTKNVMEVEVEVYYLLSPGDEGDRFRKKTGVSVVTLVEKKKIAKDTSKVELGFEMVLAMEGRRVRST